MHFTRVYSAFAVHFTRVCSAFYTHFQCILHAFAVHFTRICIAFCTRLQCILHAFAVHFTRVYSAFYMHLQCILHAFAISGCAGLTGVVIIDLRFWPSSPHHPPSCPRALVYFIYPIDLAIRARSFGKNKRTGGAPKPETLIAVGARAHKKLMTPEEQNAWI